MTERLEAADRIVSKMENADFDGFCDLFVVEKHSASVLALAKIYESLNDRAAFPGFLIDLSARLENRGC